MRYHATRGCYLGFAYHKVYGTVNHLSNLRHVADFNLGKKD
jgi:hypothetical protein